MASPLSGGGERPVDLSLMPGIASFHELEEKCELGIKLGMPAGERSLLNGSASAATDILVLGRQSKSLGRCWDVLKVVSCLQSSLWASPHRPTQC